jgi:hypothetical protein
VAKARMLGLKLDRNGWKDILQSGAMLDACMEAGKDVAARAGDGYTVIPEPEQRSTRASANVIDPMPGAIGREAATGNLARAVSSLTEAYKWR